MVAYVCHRYLLGVRGFQLPGANRFQDPFLFPKIASEAKQQRSLKTTSWRHAISDAEQQCSPTYGANP
uniref:Uncharacterized protein n=1 Tax=Leersia perrieri TaxID=77586 RepID=A0A0D9UY29_9ORYZ